MTCSAPPRFHEPSYRNDQALIEAASWHAVPETIVFVRMKETEALAQ